MTDLDPHRLDRGDGEFIAYQAGAGAGPAVVFCPGFNSDMAGIKATALADFCAAESRAYVRFDYFGHGLSSGDVIDGTIGRWADDAVAVIDHLTDGPVVLVGSSMGGWIMLLAALARPERIAGLVGIAPAPDFTRRLWDNATDDVRHTLKTEGVYRRPSQYSDEPYTFTLKLIEDGNARTLLDRPPIPIHCPVRILHGMADPDVPWALSLALVDALASKDVDVTFVKSGDHRLSTPSDIDLLTTTVGKLLAITDRVTGN
ncbi:MAG: alpha/beta hydrolase [Alphaproteobacteria bacterium]|nr:alpha/beta hydrolase [Alphaproteobacteria bacterium]